MSKPIDVADMLLRVRPEESIPEGQIIRTIEGYMRRTNGKWVRCEPPGKDNNDAVNHPKHYRKGNLECIDVIEELGLCFHLGNTLKYLWRCEDKGNELQDLKKARWYLDRKIQLLEKELK